MLANEQMKFYTNIQLQQRPYIYKLHLTSFDALRSLVNKRNQSVIQVSSQTWSESHSDLRLSKVAGPPNRTSYLLLTPPNTSCLAESLRPMSFFGSKKTQKTLNCPYSASPFCLRLLALKCCGRMPKWNAWVAGKNKKWLRLSGDYMV